VLLASSTLGKNWKVDDNPNGVSEYLKKAYNDITRAINALDNDIAGLQEWLGTKKY